MSGSDFFRQPRRVQELVKQGKTLLVTRLGVPAFEVHPIRQKN